jgi:hypothetical protein
MIGGKPGGSAKKPKPTPQAAEPPVVIPEETLSEPLPTEPQYE